MEASGGFPVRSILRAILAVALLLGGGLGDWTPTAVPGHESCCCGTPAGTEDSCPCPKPEGNRTPTRSTCTDRTAPVASSPSRKGQGEQGERHTEPSPVPTGWDRAVAVVGRTEYLTHVEGRDPDLGRHLASLGTSRI